MALTDSVGLLFKIKGDSSDAVRALKDTENASDSLSTSTSGLASAFSPMSVAALAGAAALTAITTAAIAGARAVYDMTKSAAEFGSEIFDASEKTGLSAERLSAMKFAADQSGTSLEAVTAASARFAKTIGDAANGSDKAQAKLDRLGVTSKDLDTALKQALTTIVKHTDGTEQMTLAMDAFGKSGADLLPFIKSFDGDLDALTKKAKELGVTIDDEAARAADEFGDQLDTLSAQFAGIARTIGFAFMPIFNDMAKSLSDFLTRNHAAIQNFATATVDVVNGVIISIQRLTQATEAATNSSVADWARWAGRMEIIISPISFLLRKLAGEMQAIGAANRQVQGFVGGSISPSLGAATTIPTGGRGGGGGGRSTADRERDKAEREAEALARRDLAAQIKIEAGNLKTVQEELSKTYDNIRKAVSADTSIADFQKQLSAATAQGVDNLLASLSHLEELEREQLKADSTENERAALAQQQEERRHDLRLKFAKEIEDTEKANWEARLERGAEEADAAQQAFEDRMSQVEEFNQALATIPLISSPDPQLAPEEEGTIFDKWATSWQEFFDLVNDTAPTLTTILGDTADILQDAFQGMANAIGNLIQQWVLYGTTGPAMMRKILAAALASIAAEAAVRAIYELAAGFASLFFDPAEAAAHFTAAALFGSIAVVSALAGRAVAGNAFKQQTGNAGAPSASSEGAGSGSREGQGSVYSGYGDKAVVTEQGRNAPMGLRVRVTDDSTWLGKMLKFEIENNSGVRTLIKGVAEG